MIPAYDDLKSESDDRKRGWGEQVDPWQDGWPRCVGHPCSERIDHVHVHE